jgi:hypothetical protein
MIWRNPRAVRQLFVQDAPVTRDNNEDAGDDPEMGTTQGLRRRNYQGNSQTSAPEGNGQIVGRPKRERHAHYNKEQHTAGYEISRPANVHRNTAHRFRPTPPSGEYIRADDPVGVQQVPHSQETTVDDPF